MDVAVQPLGESTSSLPIVGNATVTNVPLHKKYNENEFKSGNKTVNIPSPASNDVAFYITKVQEQVSHSDEEALHY